MTEKLWKRIFAISIWLGSILGVLGYLQYVLYYFNRNNEVFYLTGSILFLCGVLVLIVSVFIAIATSIYFIFDKN